MSTYTYTITGFIPEVFICELIGKDYEQYFTHHDQAGDSITLNFSQALTGAQETDLDGIVATHPDLKWQLKIHLENYRWQRETGGILSNGYGIDTSDRSKALINGAYNLIKEEATPTALMDFKTAQGWQSLQHSTIESIALDVADHVRKCFHCEKHITNEIDLGNITTTAGVVNEFETEYAAS